MDRSQYYMNLPKDLSGSITKNRFRLELLWGISKVIDIHKEGKDYTIIFDFKCDIEIHIMNYSFIKLKQKRQVLIMKRICAIRKIKKKILF